jgi:hypothetical protein
MTYDLEASYDVEFGTDLDGGCRSYQDQVRTAYGEALDIIQGSLDAMNDLQQPMPADKASAASNEWRRKADSFFALFGAKLPGNPNGWQPSNDKATPDGAAWTVWRESSFQPKILRPLKTKCAADGLLTFP